LWPVSNIIGDSREDVRCGRSSNLERLESVLLNTNDDSSALLLATRAMNKAQTTRNNSLRSTKERKEISLKYNISLLLYNVIKK
jgi:hypothetical protein